MNRRMVDLIGGVATVAILLIGVLVFALPLFGTANATMSDAADVRAQNGTQQTVLDALTAQSATLSDVEAEVARLRAGIPATEHVEDLVELAVAATEEHGGTLMSVTPTPSVAFAPRTLEPGAEAPAAPAPEPTAEPAPAEGGAEAAAQPAASAAPDGALPDGPAQTEVTLEFDVPDIEAGTAIIDALRSGPRLVAVTRAETATEDDGITLTVTVLVFSRP